MFPIEFHKELDKEIKCLQIKCHDASKNDEDYQTTPERNIILL